MYIINYFANWLGESTYQLFPVRPAQASLNIELSFSQPLDHFGVAVVKEAARICIQGFDRLHVLPAQFKIKDVKILFHPFLSDRFGNRHDTPLNKPTQDYLRDRFFIFPGY